MSAASDYLENELLDHALGVGAYTMPTTLAVQLHTGAAGEAGTANVATNNVRAVVTFNASGGGTGANATGPSWTNVSTTETYSHFSIWDNTTAGAGNCLIAGGVLTAPVAVTAGDNFSIPAGDLTVTLA